MNLIDEVLRRVLDEQGLPSGRMLSASKSFYHENHRENIVFFNACIFIRRKTGLLKHAYQQVWWGDIDLTLESDAVQKVANLRKEPLYVTSEGFGRFDGIDDKKIAAEKKDTLYRDNPRVYIYEPQSEEDWPGKPDEAF